MGKALVVLAVFVVTAVAVNMILQQRGHGYTQTRYDPNATGAGNRR